LITFLGTSHAAEHLRDAARDKGIDVTDEPRLADVIFVSQDTITDDAGNRDLRFVRDLVVNARIYGKPIVITSQVTPGFTRAFGALSIYHQAETLRIKDAKERAAHPEQLIVGCAHYQGIDLLPSAYRHYLEAWGCPIRMVTYEDAEFAKIAINMVLASQVDTTNRLAKAAGKVGATWAHVAEILKLDKRIGPHAYLEPGRWQDSKHLLRDHVTLEAILAR
jgi:UDPglucose 6-dehydrogenase